MVQYANVYFAAYCVFAAAAVFYAGFVRAHDRKNHFTWMIVPLITMIAATVFAVHRYHEGRFEHDLGPGLFVGFVALAIFLGGRSVGRIRRRGPRRWARALSPEQLTAMALGLALAAWLVGDAREATGRERAQAAYARAQQQYAKGNFVGCLSALREMKRDRDFVGARELDHQPDPRIANSEELKEFCENDLAFAISDAAAARAVASESAKKKN